MLMNNGRKAGTTSILSLKTGSRRAMPTGPKGEKRPADVLHCYCLLLGDFQLTEDARRTPTCVSDEGTEKSR
jgi:hypothetical protein